MTSSPRGRGRGCAPVADPRHQRRPVRRQDRVRGHTCRNPELRGSAAFRMPCKPVLGGAHAADADRLTELLHIADPVAREGVDHQTAVIRGRDLDLVGVQRQDAVVIVARPPGSAGS